MPTIDIPHQRLNNQHLVGPKFETAAEVVAYLGAVQAQDYLGALWAIGLRLQTAVEADIERALADRTIVRTWPMRSTLHFVTAADVRWMLELLTPRVMASSASRRRQLELDEAVFARSRKAIVPALQGGKQLSRESLYALLDAAHISTANSRGLHILAHLSQQGLLCFGARVGKQQTFALLDEWVPAARRLERDEALAELTRRYFVSHGPATARDFAWWSGLTLTDVRRGLDMVKAELAHDVMDDQEYWLAESAIPKRASPTTALLLPNYDEYIVSYADRSAVYDGAHTDKLDARNNVLFMHTLMINGQIVGTWKRTLQKKAVAIEIKPFRPLTKVEQRAVTQAAEQYGAFLELPVVFA